MTGVPSPPVRPLNDPQQYDDLADAWWDPRGRFAMLHWISQARARLVPPGTGLLLDLACGAGLTAPHVAAKGYRHVGLDLSATALPQAREHGVVPVRGDVTRLPFRDEVADVVVAGEILEHVPDPAAVVAEACRVLRPGGTLVVDTIAATWWGRFSSVTVGERIPAGPPRRLHDPALFVDRDALVAAARRGGVELELSGLRPSARDYLGWVLRRREGVRMLPTRSTAGLFQAHGRKAAPAGPVRTAGPDPAAKETSS
jgi:2-polyprenyl-6-hydroxyphenyl methylase/3-demethylubiquinone-9 3-methyltransferase